MSNRERWTVCCAGLALLLALAPAAGVQARGKQVPTVVCIQDGVETTEVAAGSSFEISGSGFKNDVYLRICVEENGCTGVRTDRDGEFWTARILYQPGTHLMRVEEVSKGWRSYRLRAMSDITVTK